uniref:Peptidase S1 domain-containing protein n=1 Tax=Ascaris lumbricoides TaxID=6252 RepID=A0A0M3HR19_ASCLU
MCNKKALTRSGHHTNCVLKDMCTVVVWSAAILVEQKFVMSSSNISADSYSELETDIWDIQDCGHTAGFADT